MTSTQVSRVHTALRRAPSEHFTVDELMIAIGDPATRSGVRSALDVLVHEGTAVKVRPNVWRCAAGQPTVPPPESTAPPPAIRPTPQRQQDAHADGSSHRGAPVPFIVACIQQTALSDPDIAAGTGADEGLVTAIREAIRLAEAPTAIAPNPHRDRAPVPAPPSRHTPPAKTTHEGLGRLRDRSTRITLPERPARHDLVSAIGDEYARRWWRDATDSQRIQLMTHHANCPRRRQWDLPRPIWPDVRDFATEHSVDIGDMTDTLRRAFWAQVIRLDRAKADVA